MSVDGLLETPLHAWHQAHQARLVDFAGWSMPVQYTSIVEEHQAVRQGVGLFDISHMGRLTFNGTDAERWLDYATTNHVARLAVDQIQYSLMANGGGGLIDDILVYRLSSGYAVVCNASNRLAVVSEFERLKGGYDATLLDRTVDTAMIAVQGPRAFETLQPLLNVPLSPIKYYSLTMGRLLDRVDTVVSRTGYTGEDGFELIVPANEAEAVWTALMEAGKSAGIKPCGLGARDTLRFEAGMPLYGHELSDVTNPYASGVGWAVKLDKGEFVGRDALRGFKTKPGLARVGLRLAGKRIARQGSLVRHEGAEIGVVTSGTFSPTLEQSLAMALIDPAATTLGTKLVVDIRGRDETAEVIKLPFYKRPEAVPSAK
ncbi:glycine cleavage system aminomethyltransferase GcvT [Singulisphaera acidiphila]|uniref:Aminomethyltransferase n=1 Tax=Singulisphaera acidiphila (strain ATCC BAA-1392 / DSM 18658 / VKM B-2454 / MOB10) TaxID=886293 RepID=L0DKU1_SINAD|nr:glycine cleavage system aminomethyltransferase GcvT [Singulisphaera acidiphila]AGA29473.1 glycine cleavage system T protein [Singulisphaera acidiphila DSM 18658]